MQSKSTYAQPEYSTHCIRVEAAFVLQTEELEAAVGENAALREAVLRGGRAKEQVDQLLEALRKERDAHASAAQQAQRAQEDNARAQQRVRRPIQFIRLCSCSSVMLTLWHQATMQTRRTETLHKRWRWRR